MSGTVFGRGFTAMIEGISYYLKRQAPQEEPPLGHLLLAHVRNSLQRRAFLEKSTKEYGPDLEVGYQMLDTDKLVALMDFEKCFTGSGSALRSPLRGFYQEHERGYNSMLLALPDVYHLPLAMAQAETAVNISQEQERDERSRNYATRMLDEMPTEAIPMLECVFNSTEKPAEDFFSVTRLGNLLNAWNPVASNPPSTCPYQLQRAQIDIPESSGSDLEVIIKERGGYAGAAVLAGLNKMLPAPPKQTDTDYLSQKLKGMVVSGNGKLAVDFVIAVQNLPDYRQNFQSRQKMPPDAQALEDLYQLSTA
ncbi:MAG: hypothetical protein IT558_01285 [Alphaproteobacteria bacterium]|nr:hypothetical protein [Alphaproteobacteria bacterium]